MKWSGINTHHNTVRFTMLTIMLENLFNQLAEFSSLYSTHFAIKKQDVTVVNSQRFHMINQSENWRWSSSSINLIFLIIRCLVGWINFKIFKIHVQWHMQPEETKAVASLLFRVLMLLSIARGCKNLIVCIES